VSSEKITREQAVAANIEVHAALANAGEYNKSPHFRPENQQKVRDILVSLVGQTAAKEKAKLLDIGCGTGFIISLVQDLVAEVHGVDITDDMMKQIDLSNGNVFLKNALAEDTGHSDSSFDLVTAYSFLDHLLDYKVVLKEAARVLKPGGIFYSDLNPNRAFSAMLENIESDYKNVDDLPISISREIKGMLHNGDLYEEDFGISKDALTNAEPEKSFNKGFDLVEVGRTAQELGFSSVRIEHDWFLGQGVILNSDSTLDLNVIEEYLQMSLPASSCFYKYLRFIFVK
jgi:2-polyprenyl-3-methyl-5-hydroxy-6-metoxy-1,4-benzoquinol methylase